MICVSNEAIIRAGKQMRSERRNSKRVFERDFANSRLSKFTLSNSTLEIPENGIHNKTGLSAARAVGVRGAAAVYARQNDA